VLRDEGPPSQLAADGPLGDFDAVAVIEDRGDLGSRAARDLEAEGSGLTEQLRMCAHRSGVGALCGLQGIEASEAPGAYPAVDRCA